MKCVLSKAMQGLIMVVLFLACKDFKFNIIPNFCNFSVTVNCCVTGYLEIEVGSIGFLKNGTVLGKIPFIFALLKT